MTSKLWPRFVYCALLAALLSSLQATGHGQTPTLDGEEWAFLTLINNYRAQNGAGPLQVSVALENSSRWMSNDMATNNTASHTDSLGRDPHTRMTAFGYTYDTYWGENIAGGYSDAQSGFNQWMTACDADGLGNCTYAHRQNMLNASFKVIGIARAYNANSTYRWYWTTDFGGYVDLTIAPNPGTGGSSFFSPGTLTVKAGSTGNLTLNLSSPAPANGLTASVNSSNPGVAGVLPTVSFAANASIANVPVTGLAGGSATIAVNTPNFGNATATATIAAAGPAAGMIVVPASVTVAPGQTAPFQVMLATPAPAGGIFIALTSSDTSKVTVGPANIFITPGMTTAPAASAPTVSGINVGTATVTAYAYGWPPASGQVQVGSGGGTTTGTTMSFSPGALTINGASTQNLTLMLSSPAPAGGLTVNLYSSNTGVALTPAAVSFAANASSMAVPVTGIGAGAATITASAAGITSATANVTVTILTAAAINVGSTTVGVGQTAALPVTLPAPAPIGGVFVTLASSDTTKATVTGSVYIASGSLTPGAPAQVNGLNPGLANITATAAGYTAGSGQVQVMVAGGNSFFSPGTLTMNTGSTGNLTLNLSAPAPAGGLTASVSSSNLSVASVPATVSFAANSLSVNVPVTGVAGGTATIAANTPNFGNATATATVSAGSSSGMIVVPANVTVAPGQTAPFQVVLATPAPPGGIFIALTSSDTSKVTVGPANIFITPGMTTAPAASAPTVSGISVGTATVTAYAYGWPTASGQVQVGSGGTAGSTMSFSPGALAINGASTQNLTLLLSSPAPAGGLMVNLNSSNPGVALAPAAVSFAANASSVNVPVTGVGAGAATITASAAGIANATANVTVTLVASPPAINVGSATVSVGQTAVLPVTLAAPAPIGGVFVTLASSDTTKATVTGSVYIASGSLTPGAPAQVNGLNPGLANITATAAGYTAGSGQVQILAGSGNSFFSPVSLTINAGSTGNLTLNLSGPAPAGGLTASVSSSNLSVAGVPATVSFAANTLSVNVPLTGIGAGTSTITANTPNFGNATATATVSAAGSPATILVPANVTVAPGQTAPFQVVLATPAPPGGIFIALTSSDTSKVTVGPANIFITPGMTTAPAASAPTVSGINVGTATVTAYAYGLPPASGQVQVGSGGGTAASSMSFSPGALTINAASTQNLTLTLSSPAPAGGLTVSLNSSNTNVASVPSTVTIPGSGSSVNVPVTGIGAGAATITASAAGIANATANVTVTTVASSSINLTSTTVGVGQTAMLPMSLSAPAPNGGMFVMLASSDTNKATVTGSVYIASGAMTPGAPAQVNGLNVGLANITATAAGYTAGSGQVQVMAGSGSSFFSPVSLTVNAGSTGSLTLNLSAPAPAGGLTASVSSSNLSVAGVPATVSFAANALSVNVPVTGLAGGTATIAANTPNFGNATATATVSAAGSSATILVPANVTVAPGQTAPFQVMLATPAPAGGIFIALTSSDTSKVTVGPANIFVSQGMTTAPAASAPTVSGINVGTATVTAYAYGLPPASAQVQVGSGGGTAASSMSFSPGALTINAASTQNLTLVLSSPAPAGGLTVSLNSSNPGVATVPSTVNIPGSGSSVNVPVTGVAGGAAAITASAPGFGSATASIAVGSSASIILPANVTLAPGATVNFPVSLGAGAPAPGVSVALISSDTSKVTITPSTLFFAQGATTPVVTPVVTGISTGTANITASAQGLTTASQQVQVGSSLSIVFQPATLVLTGTTTQNLTLALSSPAPAGGLTLNINSSNPSVATAPSTVTVPANTSTVNVPVTSVAAGTAVIQASSLPLVQAAIATLTVVSSPAIILPSFDAVGIRNSVDLPVALSAPAPAGGVTVTLTSSDSTKYTVTPSVFIAAGTASPATQPRITGGDSISSEGWSMVTASAPGYTPAHLDIHVSDEGTISVDLLTIGLGQTVPLPVALPTPRGGLTLTLLSGNPALVSMTPNAYIPPGSNIPVPPPLVTGVNLGTTTVDVSAPGFTSGFQSITVGATLSFSSPSVTISSGATQNLKLNLSGPAPVGGLTINLGSNNTTAVTVPAFVTFAQGATSVNVPVTGVGSGSATITAVAFNVPNVPPTSAIVSVSFTQTGAVNLPANVLVGLGQSVAFPVTLSSPAPAGGATITLTSSDPTVITITPPTVVIPPGATSAAVTPRVNGVAFGAVMVTASAAGLTTASQLVMIDAGLTASVVWNGACLVNATIYGITGNFQAIDFSLTTPSPVPVQGTLFFTPNCDPNQGLDNMNDNYALTGTTHMIQGFSHFPDKLPSSAMFWVGYRTLDGKCPPGSPCSGCVTYTTSTRSCN